MQYLAENSLAFGESAYNETIGDPRNGNFLGLAKLLAKFNSIMAEHLAKVNSNTLSDHYLSKTMQNELIDLMSSKSSIHGSNKFITNTLKLIDCCVISKAPARDTIS